MEPLGQPLLVHLDHWEQDDLRCICGIANSGGGTLVIDDGGRAAGGFRRMKRPFEKIPQLVERELGITCVTEPVLNGTDLCLEVIVPGVEEPIALNGTYWFYEGANLVRKSASDIAEETKAAAEEATNSWETRPQPQAKISDLSAGSFMALSAIQAHEPDQPGDTIDDMLDRRLVYLNLKAPNGTSLNNAGVLILHAQPERFIPGASVRVGMFDETGTKVVRQAEVAGPITRQIEEAVRILFEEFIPSAMSDSNEGELACPPQEVVSEVITNALAHKDYESGTPVRVIVQRGHLVIENPAVAGPNAEGGSGAAGEQDLSSQVSPRPANPVLANALRQMGVMKGWGGSIAAAIDACLAAGFEAPKVTLGDHEAVADFALGSSGGQSTVVGVAESPQRKAATQHDGDDDEPRGAHAAPASHVTAASGSGAQAGAGADDVEQSHASTTKKHSAINPLSAKLPKDAPFTMRSFAAANDLDLTSTDEYVLRVLHTNGRATAPRIAAVLGVSESTVRRSFRKLREHELIKRIGSDKAGYWKVLE